MKIANEESNGPVSPVWHSLKGFSSREGVQVGPGSPGAASLGTQSFPLLSSSLSSGPSPSALRSSKGTLNPSDSQNFSYLPEDESESNYHPQDNLETPSVLNASCGLSTSTTSTSLSNPNLVTTSHVIGLGGTMMVGSSADDTLHSVPKDDPQSFSLYRGISTTVVNFLYRGLSTTVVNLYRHARYSKKARKRIVHKNGECNITKANVSKRRKRFLQDIFTTLLDIQWRWTLLIFALSFVLSWIMFAAVWYAIVYNHGDLLPDHLPDKQEESGWTPCIINIVDFASCFLFSVETQHTIGYGSRHTTEECPEAIFVMCIQSITGVILQAFMGGVIFTKLSRPKKRTHTLIFSREACICLRDGELCLLFRIGDMRKSHIIEAHIRVQLIKERVTEEGEIIPYYQYELDVGYDGGEDRILFIWPMTIVHKIDEDSPLYEVSAHDLLQEKFEIIMMLEGVIENTGMTIQARSSYLPSEIKWGYRFRPILSFRDDIGECTVDYSLFNSSYEVTTPLCSAKYLQEASSGNSTPASPVTPMSPLSPQIPNSKPSNDSTKPGLSRTSSLASTKLADSTGNLEKSTRKNSQRKIRHVQEEEEQTLTIPTVTTSMSIACTSDNSLNSYCNNSKHNLQTTQILPDHVGHV